MMRILHVYSGNLYGGIETMLLTMARHRTTCRAIDFEIALFFDGRLSAQLAPTGVRVHRLPGARASRPASIWRARRSLADVIDGGRFDIVVCHAAWTQALFGGVARRGGRGLVFWAHDAATGAHWTERLARRVRPDFAICNSRYTAQTLAVLYPDVPAAVVAPPVDSRPAFLTAGERVAVRRELNTRPDATVIIQISRMERWKGHAAVLDALGRLRTPARSHSAAADNWVWWVAGGPQRPEEVTYGASLRNAAEHLGIADRVRWLGERRDVPRLLAAADVYCQANTAPEPFGMAYVEALAAGLPVVASEAGGAVEIIDSSCGLLVPPGDTGALAAALGRLLSDQELRASLGSNGPPRARHLCDPAQQLGRLADLVTAMLATGAPP